MGNVRIDRLEKIYKGKGSSNDFRAVKGIDLSIEAGEFMVLVGPSGCGKSTTLRMIAGLEEVTSGSISIDSKVIDDLAPKDREIAMVFQNYALYPHMSVFENMAFALKLSKVSKAEIEKRVIAAAKILGLEDLLQRKPQALSGGQRQRVAVGRAIVRDPKVFLFDEPLSNLDAKMRASMRVELMKLHKRLSATMIYVTHDQVEAMTMGDRICVMLDGEILQVDTPVNVYDFPSNRFVASFMGSPSMNFIEGELLQSADAWSFSCGDECVFGYDADRFYATKGAVTLGIRPEDLSLSKEGEGSLKGCIELVETLGAETLYHVELDIGRVIVRSQGRFDFEAKDIVFVGINPAKVHFFDLQEGRSLRRI